MEVFTQNDDEKEYLARREQRRARMNLEKRRRAKRRRMIKLVLALLVIVVVAGAGLKMLSGKKSGQKTAKESMQEMGKKDPIELQDAEMVDTSDVEAEGMKEEVLQKIEFHETEHTSAMNLESIVSGYGILVDEETSEIIAEKGAKERISPASMTKVLTVLVAAEQLETADLEETFTMTLEITDYSYVNDCSNAGFLDGEKVKVKDLFYGTILPSGADAAVGLAVYTAGSHEAFVELMNDKLEELGLADSAHFTNCVGLYDPNHYCTLYDMAVIMKAAMDNELCKEILGERFYTTQPTEQHPEGIELSNWFIRRIEDKDTGGEILGAKTGFVVESGSCAVSYSMQENGNSYICATAGSSSSWRCIYDHVDIYNHYIP